MTEITSASWRALHISGTDMCTLSRTAGGWTLAGNAMFDHKGSQADVVYRVDCDAVWRAVGGEVAGVIADRDFRYRIRKIPGGWTVNGAPAPGVEAVVDLDYGFTPATNMIPVKRAALAIGVSAQLPAAWFDLDSPTLVYLPQTYTRKSADTYWYESPSAAYAALLKFSPNGFVQRYPGLWDMIPAAAA